LPTDTNELVEQLRADLESMSNECRRVNDVNRTWQLEQQQQHCSMLAERFRLTRTDHTSFEQLVEQIEQRVQQLDNERHRTGQLFPHGRSSIEPIRHVV
jgi:septal ring factor EnvC (AmiA/AmiB activator)